MEQNLDEILGGEPLPDTPAEPEAAVEPEKASQPRGPDGKFAPKETGVEEPQEQAAPEVISEAPPAPQSNQLPREEYQALRVIRDENRELKAAIAELRHSVTRQPEPQQPPVDFWDDPQSFMDQRMSQLSQTLLQQWEQRETARRFDASEKAARSRHADFDDAYQAFEQAVQANPRLAYELAQAEDPGEYAYAKGKTALAIQTVGSVDDLRAQIRAELEAELKAQVPSARLPSTTAADGSVGSRSGPEWGGPTPITDILQR